MTLVHWHLFDISGNDKSRYGGRRLRWFKNWSACISPNIHISLILEDFMVLRRTTTRRRVRRTRTTGSGTWRTTMIRQKVVDCLIKLFAAFKYASSALILKSTKLYII